MFPSRRRQAGGKLGLLLLGYQIMNVGLEHIPPITLATIGAQIAIFLRLLDTYWPSVGAVCISPLTVWYKEDWKRLILGALYHADDWHLYFNMVSFMWKGRTLEKRLGSGYFAYMLAVFTVLTSVTLVGLNMLAEHALGDSSYIRQCAVGFSGVIFALKIVTTHMLPPGVDYVMNIIPVPTRIACWVELVLIQVLVPGVSFTGHLAGILVGLAYVKGPLKYLMEPLASLFAMVPRGIQVNHGAGRSGYRRGDRPGHQPGYNTGYAAPPGGGGGYGQHDGYAAPPGGAVYGQQAGHAAPPDDEDAELQEAIRQSMRNNYMAQASAPELPVDGGPPSPSTGSGGMYPDLSKEDPSQQSYQQENDINEMRRRRLEHLQKR